MIRRLSIPMLVLVAAWVLIDGAAHAAGVRARIDSSNATVGAAVTLTITVTGTRSVGQVHTPSLPTFDVVPGPTQMRSSYVNGRATQQFVLTYYLYPREVGSFTIDPFGIEAGGTTVWTSPLTVDVAASRAPAKEIEDHFLEAYVDPVEPYAGQVVVFHLRFGFASSVNNPQVGFPDWGGLLKEAAVEPEVTDTYEVIGGRTFHVVEWKIPLFSLRPGEYEIGSAELTFDQVVGVSRRTRPLFNDPLFEQLFSSAQLRPVHLNTEPLQVEVMPLPESGKPEGFSGLVGTARLQGNLSRTRCAVGESATLSLLLQGTGNLRDVDLAIEAPEGLKVYPEEPIFDLDWDNDGPRGRIAQRFNLVPLLPGEALVPEISISYFDPVRGRYRTTEAGPFRLSIDAGADESHGAHSADLLMDERAIEMLNREPYPAVLTGGARRLGTPLQFVLIAAALVLPVGIFGAGVVARQRRRRLADPELQRRRKALRRALARLEEAEAGAGDRIAAVAAAEESLRTFLAERAGVATGALSPEELEVEARAVGLSEESATAIGTWMRDVASVRYAGRTEPAVGALVERARQLLLQLQEELL